MRRVFQVAPQLFRGAGVSPEAAEKGFVMIGGPAEEARSPASSRFRTRAASPLRSASPAPSFG